MSWSGTISGRTRLALAMASVMAACSGDVSSAVDGTVPSSGASLVGARLYVSASSPALEQARVWRTSRPADALHMDRMGAQPTTRWLSGGSTDAAADARATYNAAAGRTPVFVAFNIPNRDCAGYSGGGAASSAAYRAWIRQVAGGVGAGSVVILEPDALPGMDCLSSALQDDRISLLSDAITVLKNAGALVYVDAGHARWHSPEISAARLRRAGIEKADGFALNVANFVQTDENIRYGEQISAQVGGKHFIVDTGRNGNGPISADAICNPRGRALGNLPTSRTGRALVDAFLWVKVPGESDGTCNGGPPTGVWWADYALELARNQPQAFYAP